MSNTTLEIKNIQFKRGKKEVLEAKLVADNLGVPKNGEPIYETDTKKLKIGDGVTAYKDLPYFGENESFEHISDEVINGKVFHVLWKVAPTTSNQVSGFTVHPETGRICEVFSNKTELSLNRYMTESDYISIAEIDALFNN